ncbi:MAG: PaaI family thioesterase [bacterium]
MYKEKVLALFEDAKFIKQLGIKALVVEKGYLKTSLLIEPFHLQQHNFIHAAVLAAMADHTAGAAATTLIKDDQEVLTIEFKINFLKPATGRVLYCESKVIRGGKTIIVAESDVYSDKSGVDKLLAKAIVTLTPVSGEIVKK